MEETENVAGETCEETNSKEKPLATEENSENSTETTPHAKEKKNEGNNESCEVNKSTEIEQSESVEELSSKQCEPKEMVEFKMIFNKKTNIINFGLDDTVLNLKKHLKTVIGLEPSMQKLMFKGLAKDEQTLRKLGVKKNSKVMVIGSKITDIVMASTPAQISSSSTTEGKSEPKESICSQKPHAKVIEKGKPDDAMIGYENKREPLPNIALKGMTNKHGNKVRLTFKLEEDQLWLGTKERTEKLQLGSIKDVISHKIDGHAGYSMIALQLGPTEQSRYWVYWVPSQYVAAIKDAILGKWQFF